MNHGQLKEFCDEFFAVEVEECFLLFGLSTRAFITGLAALKLYGETGDSLWRSRGENAIKRFKLWTNQGSSWNFEHKLQLLEAEHSHYCGNFKQATESYEKSIASAKAHKFINDEALACELAGKFFLKEDNLNSSLEHLRLAHEKYCEWGAQGKADQLLSFINTTFAHAVSS